ncbi:MAG: ADP,ATP carrier protein 1 [Chlamydiae bacterium]|nr:ADP,ATP carrier protein 1 [Chlamydiota bacterium]
MAEVTEKPFGKLRSFFWPIHSYELKKIVPLLIMFLCVSFNYTILRDAKDALIVTAPGSGAEAIPFLKVWCVVPFAIVFMVIYAKLSNVLSKQKLFYAAIVPFLVFFGLFAAVIYPMKDILHPTHSADMLQNALPQGLMGLVAIYRNWTFALFYVMSELWGSVALSLVLWGFVNDITRVTEAKRFYTLLGLGANVALLISGPLIMHFANVRATLPANVDAWGVTLNYLMSSVIASGVVLLGVYSWMQKNVLTDPRFYDPKDLKKKKSKPKMGMLESFKFLAKSRYLGCIAILVIAYGVGINLIEVTWKGQLKLQYPNTNDYVKFMGMFSTVTGAMTIFMMLFVGGNLLRKKGWTFTALLTPVMILITGTLFFTFVIFRANLSPLTALLGVSPLMLGVIFGMVQNILSKSSKYSMFDPTKEMAYIPLDPESKVKGKAAIDVVGARLGKSGGSLLQQGLIVGFGSLAAITPYVAIILFIIIAAWITAGKSLGKQFNTLTLQQEEARKAEALAAQSATSGAEASEVAAVAKEETTVVSS